MEIWAHRIRQKPQDVGNGEDGLIALYNLGIRHFETDTTYTPDGKIIMYHHGSTYPDVSKMTWPEIGRSIFKIMTLSDFLNIFKSCRGMLCCLELKLNSEQLVEDVVSAIMGRGLQERIFLTAFQKKIDLPLIHTESDGQLLLYAKGLNPAIRTHLIAGQPWKLPELVKRFRPDMISFGWVQEPMMMRVMTKPLFKLMTMTVDMHKKVREVQAMGVRVMGGIVNDIESMGYFAKLGVDGIMTDEPLLAMKVFQKIPE